MHDRHDPLLSPSKRNAKERCSSFAFRTPHSTRTSTPNMRATSTWPSTRPAGSTSRRQTVLARCGSGTRSTRSTSSRTNSSPFRDRSRTWLGRRTTRGSCVWARVARSTDTSSWPTPGPAMGISRGSRDRSTRAILSPLVHSGSSREARTTRPPCTRDRLSSSSVPKW